MIEAELGSQVSSVFRDLEADTLPIAAASLGQVYRVRLAGAENQVVAVKVSESGVEDDDDMMDVFRFSVLTCITTSSEISTF